MPFGHCHGQSSRPPYQTDNHSAAYFGPDRPPASAEWHVGDWPLNLFDDEQAAAELPTLRAMAAADIHQPGLPTRGRRSHHSATSKDSTRKRKDRAPHRVWRQPSGQQPLRLCLPRPRFTGHLVNKAIMLSALERARRGVLVLRSACGRRGVQAATHGCKGDGELPHGGP